jgi:hypothetical protein
VNALDILALAEHARRALLVVCAQIASSRGELSPETWPRFTAYTLGTACELFKTFSTDAAELRSGIPSWDVAAAAIRELTGLQRLRNEIAHRGAGDALHAIAPFLPNLAAIYELGTELGSRVSRDSLRSVIDLDDSGEWCLLDPASSKPRYIGLADLRFEVPVPAHRLTDWEFARAKRDPVALATPPYLRALYGFWDAPADDASAQKQVTRRLRWVALICIAQLTAHAPLRERLRSWRAAQDAAGPSLFSHVEGALTDHPSVPTDLRRRVTDLLSILTSGPSVPRSEARSVFDLAAALGAVAADAALSPFVREVAPSSWGLLRVESDVAWPRVVLLSTGEAIDAPRDAAWATEVVCVLAACDRP